MNIRFLLLEKSEFIRFSVRPGRENTDKNENETFKPKNIMPYLIVFCLILLSAYGLLSMFGRFTNSSSEDGLSPLLILGLAPLPFPAGLYFCLCFLPGQPLLFYFCAISLSLLLPVVLWGKSGWQYCTNLYRNAIKYTRLRQGTALLGGGIFLFAVIGAGIICIYVPLVNFDMLEYSVLGQQFLADHRISYHGIMYFPETGFYYRAFHSFLFPLFSSWGKLLSSFFGGNPDFFIKLVHYYYFLMQNLLCFAVLYRLSGGKYFWWISGLLLLNPINYTMNTLGSFGIDAFRIYFLTASFLLLWRYLNTPSVFNRLLLVIFLSISANAHVLGALMAPFMTLAAFGASGTISQRFRNTAFIGIGVLCLGYFHYFLQTFWGDGWIIFGKPVIIPQEDLQMRGFNLPIDYLLKGYLGQFFNFKFFGLNGIITCPVIVWLLIHLSRFSRPEKSILTAYFLCSVLTGYFFYNYRYQYTLYPITILIVFTAVLQKKIIYPHFKRVLIAVLLLELLLVGGLLRSGNYYIDKIFYVISQRDGLPHLSIETINRLPKKHKAVLGLVHNKKFNYPDSKKVILYYSHWEDILYNREMEPLLRNRNDQELQEFLCSNFAYVILQHSYVPPDHKIVRMTEVLGKLIYSDHHYKIYELPEVIR